jgi:predicted DNA-binding antitoxin AbrB/MazE fold protein
VIILGKAIKARYKDGVIRPLIKLNIPDDTEINIIISSSSEKAKKKQVTRKSKTDKDDWLKWQGILEGTTALQDHEREHREEVEREEGS